MGQEGGYMMSFAHELNSLVFKMSFSYFLYLWFFPRLRMVRYIPIALIILAMHILLYNYFDSFFHGPYQFSWKQSVASGLTYVSFGVLFFALFSIREGYEKQIIIERLHQEKQEAELKVLKAQLNPHFLFNTLNTIYANALKKDDKTPDLILKLSDSLRYVLHQGEKKQVPIKEEIQHLEDYINLQQERLSEKINVLFSKSIDEKEIQIAPLLLISFVENAFKYTSILKGFNHQIEIKLILENGTLFFQCKNPYNEDQIVDNDPNWGRSGIGIESTQKRLKLLYSGRHRFNIKRSRGIFIVNLKIQL